MMRLAMRLPSAAAESPLVLVRSAGPRRQHDVRRHGAPDGRDARLIDGHHVHYGARHQ